MARNCGGGYGCDHDGAESGDAEISQNDFQGEHGTCNRGIEGCRNTGRGAAPHQGFHTICRDFDHLADAGADGRPDLHNGSLAAHRSPCGDTDGRSQGFDKHDPLANHAAFERYGLHDLGNTVSLGLPGEPVDQKSDDESAPGRDQQPQMPGDVYDHIKEFLSGAVGDGLKKIDQITKADRTESTRQPHGQGQDRHDGMFILADTAKGSF